jgi:hypothetical protein
VADQNSEHPIMDALRSPFRVGRRLLSYIARTDSEWRQQRGLGPFPLYRWTAGIGVLIWTAVGTTDGISGWWHGYAVWIVITAAGVIGPEVTKVEIGGMKLEMLRETRAELRALNAQVTQLQLQQVSATSGAAASNYKIKKQVIKKTEIGEAAKDIVTETVKGQLAEPVPAEQVLAKYATADATPESAWSAGPARSVDLGSARGVPYAPPPGEGTVRP